jgi:T4 RnlA family RNA ligase
MVTLKIQDYLINNGLEKTLQDFELNYKLYDNKIVLKYNQLSSPTIMSNIESQECRGLILELNTWKVMGMAFKKFFNYGESNAHNIDWNTAKILEKSDGSLINLYYDWHDNKWYAATTGTANGEGDVNGMVDMTFNDLFWLTANKYGLTTDKLKVGFSYVFELMTPYNIVVKPHSESSLNLLTIRNLTTLDELSHDEVTEISKMINIPVVKEFNLNKDINTLIETFKDMLFYEEGYVVVDNKFRRIKLKNPAYVCVHHLKDKSSFYNILSIIKNNELEEFISVFKEREDEINELKSGYDLLTNKLYECWDILSKDITIPMTKDERKQFAVNVFMVCSEHDLNMFTGLFFSLCDNKIDSIEKYLYDFDNKKLYNFLKIK